MCLTFIIIWNVTRTRLFFYISIKSYISKLLNKTKKRHINTNNGHCFGLHAQQNINNKIKTIRVIADYTQTIRILYAYYAHTIRILYAYYTHTIRILYADYTHIIRILYAYYTQTIRRLYADYTQTIRILYANYTHTIRKLYALLFCNV